jgi:hypothetical protein
LANIIKIPLDKVPLDSKVRQQALENGEILQKLIDNAITIGEVRLVTGKINVLNRNEFSIYHHITNELLKTRYLAVFIGIFTDNMSWSFSHSQDLKDFIVKADLESYINSKILAHKSQGSIDQAAAMFIQTVSEGAKEYLSSFNWDNITIPSS